MLPGQLSQDDCAGLFTRHPLIDKGKVGWGVLQVSGERDWAVRVTMAARVGRLRHRFLVALRSMGSNRAGMDQLAGLKLTLIVFFTEKSPYRASKNS